MSVSFDGVDDRVASTAAQTLGTTVTIAAWINAVDQGEGDVGTIFTFGTAGSARWRFGWNSVAASKKLRVMTARATTLGSWEMTTGFAAVTGWKFVAHKLDIALTTNDPTMWVWEPNAGTGLQTLTVGSGLTETSAPAGGLSETDNRTVYAGNNSALNQTWGGLIGEFALWTTLLTSEEIAALAVNGMLAAASPFLYWPMDNTGAAQALDFSGNGRHGTLSGGAGAGANPPIRPAMRRG